MSKLSLDEYFNYKHYLITNTECWKCAKILDKNKIRSYYCSYSKEKDGRDYLLKAIWFDKYFCSYNCFLSWKKRIELCFCCEAKNGWKKFRELTMKEYAKQERVLVCSRDCEKYLRDNFPENIRYSRYITSIKALKFF